MRHGMCIEQFDEDLMERHGWVRKEKVEAQAKAVLTAYGSVHGMDLLREMLNSQSPSAPIAAVWHPDPPDIKAAIAAVKEQIMADCRSPIMPRPLSEGQQNVLKAMDGEGDCACPSPSQWTFTFEAPKPDVECRAQAIMTKYMDEIHRMALEHPGEPIALTVGGEHVATIEPAPKLDSYNVAAFKSVHRDFRRSKRAGREDTAVKCSAAMLKLARACSPEERSQILREVSASYQWFSCDSMSTDNGLPCVRDHGHTGKHVGKCQVPPLPFRTAQSRPDRVTAKTITIVDELLAEATWGAPAESEAAPEVEITPPAPAWASATKPADNSPVGDNPFYKR